MNTTQHCSLFERQTAFATQSLVCAPALKMQMSKVFLRHSFSLSSPTQWIFLTFSPLSLCTCTRWSQVKLQSLLWQNGNCKGQEATHVFRVIENITKCVRASNSYLYHSTLVHTRLDVTFLRDAYVLGISVWGKDFLPSTFHDETIIVVTALHRSPSVHLWTGGCLLCLHKPVWFAP